MRNFIEDIKLTLMLIAVFIGFPLLMFLHWLAFGY